MNIKQLKELLENYPEDTEVFTTDWHHDYCAWGSPVEVEEVFLTEDSLLIIR